MKSTSDVADYMNNFSLALDELTNSLYRVAGDYYNGVDDAFAAAGITKEDFASFVTTNTMKECINAVANNEYDSSFCATVIQDFLWEDNKPLNFDATNLPRSQDLKPIYRETSGVYVFKREVFNLLKRRIGNNPYIKVVSFKEAVDINNPEDFSLAEALLNINL